MDAETTKLVREALESAIYWTSTGAPSRAVGGAMILEGLRKALDVLPTEPSDDLAKLADEIEEGGSMDRCSPGTADGWSRRIRAHRCAGLSEYDREWLLEMADNRLRCGDSYDSARLRAIASRKEEELHK